MEERLRGERGWRKSKRVKKRRKEFFRCLMTGRERERAEALQRWPKNC